MDLLKKIFPYSFTEKKDLASAVIMAIIYLVVVLVIFAVMGLIGRLDISIINWLLGIIGGAIEIYLIAGIVLIFLDYYKILK